MSRIKEIIKPVLVALFWVGVWTACAAIVNKSVILPSPFAVAKELGKLLVRRDFYKICALSLGRIFLGLMAGIAVGGALAVITRVWSVADKLLSPIVEIVKSTPVASIIILLLFLLKKDFVPMLAAALMVVPIIFMNVAKGIESAPKDRLEVASVYDFSRAEKLRLIYIPSVLPYFSAGARSALGLAWKAGIAAEVICTPKSSIGAMLYDSKIYLESELLFAWTAVVIIFSFAIEKLVIWLLGKLLKGGTADAEA